MNKGGKMPEKTITCPKCGQENPFSSEECTKCGSSFALFPELQHLFKDKKKSTGEIKKPASGKDDQKERPIACPKCGQENDASSLDCSKCGIVFLKYYEIQARDEADEEKRAELLAKKEEEEKRIEALERKKEEEERAELLRKQKEEEERAELLRKQKEEEEKAEALRKQKEEEEKAEALRKQKEEEEKAEALRKQKEEEEKTEALRRQKEKEEEEEKVQKKLEEIVKELKPKPKIKDVLKKYEGQTIGINYDSPTEVKDANLVKVGDDLFSIVILDDELMKSYPLTSIMSVTEGVNVVSPDDSGEKSPFSAIIQVYNPIV
jgi:ribosomal protein L40E